MGMSYKKCKDCPHCDWFYAMGGDPYFVYDEEDPPERPGKRIDLTKYNKWSVIGWTIIAVLLLADIVISALY